MMRPMLHPEGRLWRRWARMMDYVVPWSRGRVSRVWGRPVRIVYVVADRAIFAWWWWGLGYEGAGRWRWYRAIEGFVYGVYAAVFFRLWAWVYANIGE